MSLYLRTVVVALFEDSGVSLSWMTDEVAGMEDSEEALMEDKGGSLNGGL